MGKVTTFPTEGIMEWISVEDRLPEEMTYEKWKDSESDSFIFFKNDLGHLFAGFFYKGTFYDGDLADAEKNHGWCDDVTHWTLPPNK
jgi:hypothetical protein